VQQPLLLRLKEVNEGNEIKKNSSYNVPNVEDPAGEPDDS
jgi:hypothetical protein